MISISKTIYGKINRLLRSKLILFWINSMFYACRVPSSAIECAERLIVDTHRRGFFSHEPVVLISLLRFRLHRPIKLARKLFDNDAPQCVIVSLGSAYYSNMPCVRTDCRITKSE